MELFKSHFAAVKAVGLGITLHIAEVLLRLAFCEWPVLTMGQTKENTPEDTLKLLSFKPDRVGHATFLNDEAQEFIVREKKAIEICLTSNLL